MSHQIRVDRWLVVLRFVYRLLNGANRTGEDIKDSLTSLALITSSLDCLVAFVIDGDGDYFQSHCYALLSMN